ncbi:MAG: hypothetical protein JWP25_6738 [Bradyrhizobium sp.]|nr:hypothetical protein [Bradyrhizobium sp.]
MPAWMSIGLAIAAVLVGGGVFIGVVETYRWWRARHEMVVSADKLSRLRFLQRENHIRLRVQKNLPKRTA